MKITDAQVHIWAADTPERPWVLSGSSYAHGASFRSDQLLAAMEEAGVDRAVLVPPSWEGDYNDVCFAADDVARVPCSDVLRVCRAQLDAKWLAFCVTGPRVVTFGIVKVIGTFPYFSMHEVDGLPAACARYDDDGDGDVDMHDVATTRRRRSAY